MRQSQSGGDPYLEIVEHYDLEHEQFRDDLALIEHLVETVGDPVLEIACGTGRVLSPLALPDRRLVGVDSSVPMLDAARRRLHSAPGDVQLLMADMSSLPLPDVTFGIVVLALNGLLHATTSTRQRSVLSEAFRCLDPRGMLYIDIANPAVHWPFGGLQPNLLEGSWMATGGDRVQKFQSIAVDPARQIVTTNLWYDVTAAGGDLRRVATNFELRYIHAPELELMLELAGFVEWQIHGNYDLEPYEAESPRIIALAEKTPSR